MGGMNPIQIHLALNHLPAVALLVGFLVIAVGGFMNHGVVRRVGLGILVFGAVLSVPAYLSGEGAEDGLKAFLSAEYPRDLVHAHEEAAEGAFICSLVAGVSAALGLWAAKTHRTMLERRSLLVTCLLAIVGFGLLVKASHLGGLIRHFELR
jgi:hypothetical protein